MHAVVAAITLQAWATPAHAQWTATIVHPTGASHSAIFVAGDGKRFGFVQFGSQYRAAVWPSVEPSWIDISGGPGVDGRITGGVPGRLVGLRGGQGGVWTGANYAWESRYGAWQILGGDGQQQVGTSGNGAALLWNEGTSSLINLTPPGGFRGAAYSAANGRQIGGAVLPQLGSRALLWSGTASSYVDLTPPGAFQAIGLGMDSTQQVGSFSLPGGSTRACLWTGSAASHVDLHPSGSATSEAFTVLGEYQAGYAHVPGYSFQAAVWRGSSQSYFNLGSVLPPLTFTMSTATAVAINGDNVEIVGYGDTAAGRRAIVWSRPFRCTPSDVAGPNLSIGPDVTLTADDITVFLGWFFASDTRADIAGPNQSTTPDTNFTADEIIVFLGRFFAGC